MMAKRTVDIGASTRLWMLQVIQLMHTYRIPYLPAYQNKEQVLQIREQKIQQNEVQRLDKLENIAWLPRLPPSVKSS